MIIAQSTNTESVISLSCRVGLPRFSVTSPFPRNAVISASAIQLQNIGWILEGFPLLVSVHFEMGQQITLTTHI